MGLVATVAAGHPVQVVPAIPPVDSAVAPNFERFTGTTPALDHPAGQSPVTGSPNRPGQAAYQGQTVYTPGRRGGLTNTLGGEPPNLVTDYRIHRAPGGYTPARATTYQLRLGVGQRGPSELGVAQTVAQATITNHPPEGTPLLQMLAGLG